MTPRRADRESRGGTVLACRSVPLPLFALYGMGAAGLTWMVAAWRDRRQTRKLREEIRSRKRGDKKE